MQQLHAIPQSYHKPLKEIFSEYAFASFDAEESKSLEEWCIRSKEDPTVLALIEEYHAKGYFEEPIILNDIYVEDEIPEILGKRYIMDGHHRLSAHYHLGLTSVYVIDYSAVKDSDLDNFYVATTYLTDTQYGNLKKNHGGDFLDKLHLSERVFANEEINFWLRVDSMGFSARGKNEIYNELDIDFCLTKDLKISKDELLKAINKTYHRLGVKFQKLRIEDDFS